MERPNIKTTEKVVPMIYAYTTPGIAYHDGYIKIGYTEQEVLKQKKNGRVMLFLMMDQTRDLLITIFMHTLEKMM